jgi:dolichol-phosphate mannosyltransferase
MPELALSIVAAAHNEQENLSRLLAEITETLDATRIRYEVIVVDDGSTDRTAQVLADLAAGYTQLRALKLLNTPAGAGSGQSAAFCAGIRAARGDVIVMLDADCQNDPADIPAMLDKLSAADADMVQGDRSADRRDNFVRRVSSRIGRLSRRVLLGDNIRDTGCSLRAIRRTVALQLPLQYRGMHRFIPLTARQLGFTVVEMPVHHRPRNAGQTKYGITNRAWPAFFDCLAVRWMHRRRRDTSFDEVGRPKTHSAASQHREKAVT